LLITLNSSSSKVGKQIIAGLLVVSLCLLYQNTFILFDDRGGWEAEYSSFAHGNAYWMRENIADGSWISDSNRLKNEAGTMSGLFNVEAKIKALAMTGELVGSMLSSDLELEVTLVWKGSRTSYEYDIADRYDPRSVEYQILALHDEQLTSQYGVKYVAIEKDEELIETRQSITGWEKNELVEFVESERYVLYERNSPENIPNAWSSIEIYNY